jgi:hypothetical protein
MSRDYKALSLALLGAALAACSLAGVSCARQEAASALVPDGYGAWRRSTELELDYAIPGHEASARTIFMNPEGFRFQKEGGNAEFPAGTIIVKEIRPLGMVTAAMPAPMLTVMIKVPDDERAQGGWLWIVKDTASKAETVFSSDFCYRCHANANEAHPYADLNPGNDFRDYVFFVPGMDIPAPLAEPAPGLEAGPEARPSGDGY